MFGVQAKLYDLEREICQLRRHLAKGTSLNEHTLEGVVCTGIKPKQYLSKLHGTAWDVASQS